LEFYHPRTGENVVVDSELPSDMKALIKGLAGTKGRGRWD
jgi:hypothetical protein